MFTDYKPTVGFDEYFCGETATPRADLAPLLASLGQMGLPELNRSHASASQLLRRLGATFRLNDSGLKGSERILPFDPLPRLICLLYTSPSPRDVEESRMPSSA